MTVTVVIACHTEERWALLLQAIESALAQSAPAAEVIVVVDHNPGLFERLRSLNLPISVVENNSARGASGARNTGAFAAKTEFIAFLDDDARADRMWLENLVRPFADPRVVGTGGRVIAGWQTEAPTWFPEEFGWVIGATHRASVPADGRVRNVWAESMAVRAEAFRLVNGFRIGFGKVGSDSRPEDTDLCIRAAGSRPEGHWMYEPSAVVVHHVPPERSTFRFFVRRCYHEGRGKAELSALLDARGGVLGTERQYALRVLPRALGRYVARGIRNPASGALIRAAAVAAGFGATLYGYALGVAILRIPGQTPSPKVAILSAINTQSAAEESRST